MRALTYHGSKDVRIENVPDPQLQHPQDLILRVTATAICGSDLHLYRGKVPGVETEYARVPMANTGPLKIPDALSDAQVLFLSDILPTGYQAVLNTEFGSGSIAATRRGGMVSVPGVYAGFIHGFLIGDAFDKGLSFRMGQTHVQQHMPQLLEHIGNGRLKPEAIISHQLPLEDAVRGYRMFDKKQDDCRKVVLTPATPAGARLATAVVP